MVLRPLSEVASEKLAEMKLDVDKLVEVNLAVRHPAEEGVGPEAETEPPRRRGGRRGVEEQQPQGGGGGWMNKAVVVMTDVLNGDEDSAIQHSVEYLAKSWPAFNLVAKTLSTIRMGSSLGKASMSFTTSLVGVTLGHSIGVLRCSGCFNSLAAIVRSSIIQHTHEHV